ncbi:enoyl-CoA hydratase-related protein [Caulobacter sp. KR2-114]|jgi:enoyl-CoA hydratase/carnithine racemase|uniref:enoyl-CoA hydratase-related protein n=1 Tax=Caulobacter sp. KR2-114 TaxID=3400912 RepID=UPI003C08DDF3
MSEHIQVRDAGGVREITFARPEKKNALSTAMYRSAREALEDAQVSPDVRVVLFAGEGEAFTAGNDLADFAKAAAGEASEPEAHRFIEALAVAQKPIIAAVPGLAVGVGMTMLLHCDLVYVADTAKLSAPFINLGLSPEAASSLLLPARIGHVRAFAAFALGEAISGVEAVSLGLANRMTSRDDVLETARAAARTLAGKPLGSVIATKRLMRDAAALARQIEAESHVFAERLTSEEAREAFRAFAERRPPNFVHLKP